MFGLQFAEGNGGCWRGAGQGGSQEASVDALRPIEPQKRVLRLVKPPVNKRISYRYLGFGRQFVSRNISVVSRRAGIVSQWNNSNAVFCFRRKVASVIHVGLACRS